MTAERSRRRWVAKGQVAAVAIASMLLMALIAQLPWAGAVPGGTASAITGAQAVPGIVQIALAGAAAGVFVAFADGLFRIFGGVLLMAAGVAAAVLAARVGLEENGLNAWPWVVFTLAVTASVAGAAVPALSRGWTRASRRFVADAGPERRRDAVSDWDRLTRGDDPTAGDETA